MPDPVGEDRQVKFYFEHDPSYRVVAANGVWAGVTARGDIKLDFFVESHGTPTEVVNLITPEGSLGPELNRTPPAPRINRRMQIGVLLSIEQADDIANFVKAKIAEFRNLTKRNQEG